MSQVSTPYCTTVRYFYKNVEVSNNLSGSCSDGSLICVGMKPILWTILLKLVDVLNNIFIVNRSIET
jgi:hypothetical protein